MQCPVCQAAITAETTICPDCGVNVREAFAQMSTSAAGTAPPVGAAPTNGVAATDGDSGLPCPSCGAARRPGAKFCRECGEPYPDDLTPQGDLLASGEFMGGRYRIERKLGGGGMGAVYLARDLNLQGKAVAIKAVLNTSDPALLKAARQEAETLLGLDHPNIVTLKDIVNKGTIPFLVMEYLEGPDWNDLYEDRVNTKGEAFAAEEAVEMILGIIPAFAYLHGRRPPVVYRDFKPGQVKVVTKEDGSIRHVLLDLGVAYRYTGQAVEAWGTAGYAPPEIGGVCLQPPTMDLATLCRTLEALLGIDLTKFPYGTMPTIDTVPWVPEELYFLIERGTARDPLRRFNTIDELQSQLEGVLRLIKGRKGTLPKPIGQIAIPVTSQHFTGNLHRTTGRLISLPVVRGDDPAAATLNQASDLLLEGKAQDALQQAEAILATNPKNTSARLLRTAALAQLNRVQDAQNELATLSGLTDVTSDWSYGMVAAQVAEDAGQLQQAEELYRGILRLLPGEIPPRQKLASLLQRQGRHQDAAKLYEMIAGADPANAEAVLAWADSLSSLGRDADAIGVLKRVGESAVRFVDAQTRMIALLLGRAREQPSNLNLAAEAISSLQGRTQTPRYFRLTGDWWYEAYQLARANKLQTITQWPLGQGPKSPREIADRAREAYRHYLRVAPNEADADEVIGRIHFGIAELM